jgi:CheY-like chemotaxis protein
VGAHSAQLAAAPALPADGSTGPGLRVLLVEDNRVNQTIVTRLLERCGHAVEVAGDGQAGLAALERGRFDLVLMDVQMPHMDGFEATAAIRARESARGDHTIIVAMTAHAMKGDRERCLAAGMDGYIAKPVDRQELLATIARLLPADAQPDRQAAALSG